MTLHEYRPGTAFPGVIGRAFDQSSPSMPLAPVTACPSSGSMLCRWWRPAGSWSARCFGPR